LRFLLDEGLSPLLVELLTDAGHDVVHARDSGLKRAADPIILAAALEQSRVLVTLDTDFGALLVLSGASVPSVVLFRGEVTRRPRAQVELLIANLPQVEDDLGEGAVVVIGDDRVRVRRLPIERHP
jgi:predicted nuclease of predicted toxin-antitoxin system